MDDEDPMTKEDVGRIMARAMRATAGPWSSFVESREGFSGSDFIRTGGEDIYLTGATVADQDFIAHARQDIPRLVTEVERLRELLNRSKGR
ncbi:hypothetical protein [Bauldia sp.]|uniref:hypothetical protein n=1 Tax=Bauldia sp. TaxID=2575872 RepID=UPI003BAA5884